MTVPREGRLCICGNHVFAATASGAVFYVSPEDAWLVAAKKWQTSTDGRYVVGGSASKPVLHRIILGLNDPSIHADHKSGDGMDNRRENLRPCTRSQNMANRRPLRGRDMPKGVSRYRDKYRADIRQGGRVRYLGVFTTPEAAALAYREAALEVHGEFARTE